VKQISSSSEIKLSILGSKFDGNRAPASGCPGSAVATFRESDFAPKLTVTLTGSKFTGEVCFVSVVGCWRGHSP